MKKTSVVFLGLIFALSTTATTLASSPNISFTDVPAKHWVYDAMNKLEKYGIIDGYSDGTFKGDKSLSRYEFSLLVVKALDKYDKADEANKQLVDKLFAEFNSELNRLDARVAKLETKVKSIDKIRAMYRLWCL